MKNFINNKTVLETAKGHWPEILESCGIHSSYLKNKHGSCPACGGKDRFRFDDNRVGSFICNHCGAGHGVKLIMLTCGIDYYQAINAVAKILRIEQKYLHISSPIKANRAHEPEKIAVPDSVYIEAQRKKLKKTWEFSRAVTLNDPVDIYLKARKITLTAFPSNLRYHPQLPYYDDNRNLVGKFPAMLALVQNKNNGNVTIHRTYLGYGCKAKLPKPKKLMTPIYPGAIKGSAIQLFEPINGILAIGEGIETCLAFHTATKLPVWASISSFGMKHIALPKSVTEAIILVDNDLSGTGQEAAHFLSKRLLAEGIKVKRVIPPTPGTDFADMLKREF